MSLITFKELRVSTVGNEVQLNFSFWTKEIRFEAHDAVEVAHMIEAVAKELLKRGDPRPHKGGHKV